MTEIQERLFALRDDKYRDFNASLIPTVDKALVIGVRVPQLRKLAKELPEGVELLGEAEPLSFDAEGNLTDKEPRQRGQRTF